VIDTHCHLDSCEPPDAELVANASAVGVSKLATVGMNDASIERALAAAQEFDGVYAIVGRHPHNTEGWSEDDAAPIETAAAGDKVVAIGETGLDYFRDQAPRDDQRRAFESQLEVAAKVGLPVVIHTRAAEEDTFAILAEHADRVTVLLHCFSAPDRLDEAVERGYYCSFAGNVTYKSAADLQEAARQVPDDLLLVETDSPYLAPVPHRGERNEPANVCSTAEFIADLRGVGYGDLDATVERNAARLFKW
jgi:TatD DNase family protein